MLVVMGGGSAQNKTSRQRDQETKSVRLMQKMSKIVLDKGGVCREVVKQARDVLNARSKCAHTFSNEREDAILCCS